MKESRHSHGLRTPAYLLGSLATNTRVVGRGGRERFLELGTCGTLRRLQTVPEAGWRVKELRVLKHQVLRRPTELRAMTL